MSKQFHGGQSVTSIIPEQPESLSTLTKNLPHCESSTKVTVKEPNIECALTSYEPTIEVSYCNMKDKAIKKASNFSTVHCCKETYWQQCITVHRD